MRVFLVAGSPKSPKPTGLGPRPDDFVIAVDRGALFAQAWGWPIDLLIGDLDSLPEAEVAALRAIGSPLITAPVEKDETDLELALAEALRHNPQEIIICAALGGRIDHMLANVLLLARPELAGRDVRIADSAQTLRLLHAAAEQITRVTLDGAPGDLLSLLPVGGDAHGVVTAGLIYPLRDETLYFARARGISNVFATARPQISLQEGFLVLIHTPAEYLLDNPGLTYQALASAPRSPCRAVAKCLARDGRPPEAA